MLFLEKFNKMKKNNYKSTKKVVIVEDLDVKKNIVNVIVWV